MVNNERELFEINSFIVLGLLAISFIMSFFVEPQTSFSILFLGLLGAIIGNYIDKKRKLKIEASSKIYK